MGLAAADTMELAKNEAFHGSFSERIFLATIFNTIVIRCIDLVQI